MALSPSKETLRNADQTIYDWLGLITVDYGRAFVYEGNDLSEFPIFRVWASPERAFANIRTLMIQQGMIIPDTELNSIPDEDLYRVLPLPACSIRRTGISPTQELHSVPSFMRMGVKSEGLSWIKYKYPTPYEAEYEINFYAKTMNTMNYLVENVLGRFTHQGAGVNRAYVNTPARAPWNSRLAEMTFQNLSDNSTLEATQHDNRSLRMTLSVTLRFYDLDLVGESVPSVQTVSRLTGLMDEVEMEFGQDPEQISGGSGPSILYRKSPLPLEHAQPYSTAEALTRVGDARQAFLLSDDEVFIETTGIPFRGDQTVQCYLKLEWMDTSLDVPPDLEVDLVWRNWQDDFADTVMQTVYVDGSLQANKKGVVEINFETMPCFPIYEVSARIRQPSGATASPRVVVSEWKVGKKNLPSDATNQSMTFLSGATSNEVSMTGLDPIRAYIVKCEPVPRTQVLTLRLYGDAAKTHLLKTQTFSPGVGPFEFVYYGAPDVDRFVLVASVPVADNGAAVELIWINRALVRPI